MWRWKFRIRYADVAATLALVLAGGGAAYAVTALPRNSVGTAQIQDGAVTPPKLRSGAVTRPKLAANAVTSAKVLDGGITSDDLAEGSVGTPEMADGSITTVKIGAAQITEGHLSGGAVRSDAVLDESLSVTDLVGAQINLNLAGTSLQAGECANYTIGATGAQPGQLAVASWLGAAPTGIVGDARVTGTNQIGYRICNLTSAQASFPGGTGVVRVVTFG